MQTQNQYVVHANGRNLVFGSLESAKKFCSDVFAQTKVVLSIVEKPQPKKQPCIGCGKLITVNRVQCRQCCVDMFGTPNEPKF